MSDDSFIREVNEELRQDRFKSLWRRYGAIAIGAAVLVVLAAAGYVAYDYWVQSRANSSGDQFAQALELAEQGESEEALAVLQELQDDGYGAYPLLARMRAGTVHAEAGDHEQAIAAFDDVAADGSIPDVIRDMARLRAGLLLVDHGSYDDVAARVEPLTADTGAFRHSAREALGLAAWKEGRMEDARVLFDQVAADEGAPRNMRQRAQTLSELAAGSAAGS